LKLRSKSRFNT